MFILPVHLSVSAAARRARCAVSALEARVNPPFCAIQHTIGDGNIV